MSPFDLPSMAARFWIEGSVQMIRTSATLWGHVLGGEEGGTPARTSTAAPWWKAPEASRESSHVFDPAAWASMWLPATAHQRYTPDFAAVWASAWAPWMRLPATAAPVPGFGPMGLWPQGWLPSPLQFAPLAASFARPVDFAAMWLAIPPTRQAATTSVPAAWQPVAAAYRSANGHAMAAVLRSLADAVEPKQRQPDFMQLWANPLGIRH